MDFEGGKTLMIPFSKNWRSWVFGCGLFSVLLPQGAGSATITGAGATFPYPLYAKWAEQYRSHSGGVELNYQSIGSGGGIKQVIVKTVDFGATDKPLKMDESDHGKDSLKKHNLLQFPAVIGGVVVVYNLPDEKKQKLKLSAQVLSEIFLGKITNWNDGRLKKDNPEANFPDLPLTVVHRSDGSGTTFLFTSYLSNISEQWAKTVGFNTAVAWPIGFGSKGNEGVAATVLSTPGAIGYVEYSYAKPNHMSYAQLETTPGVFVEPSIESFQAAASKAQWDKKDGFYMLLTNLNSADCWPITGASYILIHKTVEAARQENILHVLKFFHWAFSQEGQKIATELSYVPLPQSLVDQIVDSWSEVKDIYGQVIWKVEEVKK